MMDSSNTQNIKSATGSRGRRSDIGWDHATKVDNDPKKIKCNYCNETMRVDINRFKHHLAGIIGDVKACDSVPNEVREQMIKILNQQVESRTMTDDELETIGSDRRKRGKQIMESPEDRTTCDINQNSEKKLRDEAYQQIARFFRTSGIPFNCAQNPEFTKMFELVEKCSLKFVPPSYDELENSFLGKEIERYKYDWMKTGCSIICDEWTDSKGRLFCNFLVNSPEDTIFIKSIDTSEFFEAANKIFVVLDEMIEMVGEENVVQVITNNAANYEVAVAMLIEKRKRIFWSPCVVQLLDGILNDFENKLPHHQITIGKGKKISTFIYSKTIVISMLRNVSGLKDLNWPTITRSTTSYLILLYLIDMKDKLVEMFSSELWKSNELSKTKEGEEIYQMICGFQFWGEIVDCLKFALPIIEVLLKIDSDWKPTMGFIYEEMKRVEERIKSLNNIKGYVPIWEIFNERWNAKLRPQYEASYLLNPELQSDATFKFPSESNEGPYTCLARMVIDYDDNLSMTADNLKKIENQIVDFSLAKGVFGSQAAIRMRGTKDPAKWWDMHGKDCPELQRMAIRLLSLTSSSCGSGQIRNAYEQVYPKKRSRLYQTKLIDLFLVIENFKSKMLKDFSEDSILRP